MSKLKSYALAAVLVAVYAVIAQVYIPFPIVPLTFQCFTVALGGYVLGWRIGLISTLLYIGIGAVGLPVFSGFRGGVAVLLSPTGGFIWGFILLSILCGLGKNKKRLVAFTLGLLGLICCNAFGALQFFIVNGDKVLRAFVTACVPYMAKDALLLWAAASLSPSITAALLRKR